MYIHVCVPLSSSGIDSVESNCLYVYSQTPLLHERKCNRNCTYLPSRFSTSSGGVFTVGISTALFGGR